MDYISPDTLKPVLREEKLEGTKTTEMFNFKSVAPPPSQISGRAATLWDSTTGREVLIPNGVTAL